MSAHLFGTRPTVRTRLTLLYATLFIVSGAVLFAIALVVLLNHPPQSFLGNAAPTGVGAPGPGNTPALRHLHWSGLQEFLVVCGIALAIMALLSLGLGWLLAGRLLRPLRTMTARARQISEHNLDQRLDLGGPRDELKDLGDTIDSLLGRLDMVFKAQRQFVANASHELRTPLTLERTVVESALTHPHPTTDLWRATCTKVLESNRKQEQLIGALLTLARSQQGLDRHDRMDLASVASEVIRSYEHEAKVKGVTIESALTHAPTSGDVRLVERLASNLVENAIRHNVAGGRLEIVVDNQDGRSSLRVSNTGERVPADDVERLLRPFERLDAERRVGDGGLGLGLSIVAAIARSHGATLQIRPGTSGGLDVSVIFPSLLSHNDAHSSPRTHNAGVMSSA